jgi:hypothetical protein
MTDIVPADQTYVDGLEDFDESDMMMPTLRIGHNQDVGVLIDNLSGERFTSLEVVILGLVKQRILWNPEIGETKEDPLCKSYDYDTGYPDPENPTRFPWSASGFQAPVIGQPVPPINCGDCPLKEWGTHPKNDSPWCTEQHTYVVLTIANDTYAPAILTLQRTSLKASRAYMSSFARTKTPMFIVTTNISLSIQKRGNVDYSVVVLGRGRPTPVELYDNFKAQYRRIRGILHTPRSGDPDEVPVAAPASTNTYQPAPAQPAAAPAPEPQPAPVATPAPAPVQPEPAPAPVAAAATVPAAVAPEPAPQVVAPVPAPVAPEPAPVPQVVAPVPAPVADIPPAAVVAPVPAPVPADVAPAAVVAPVPADVAPPAMVQTVATAVPAPAPISTVSDDELPF